MEKKTNNTMGPKEKDKQYNGAKKKKTDNAVAKRKRQTIQWPKEKDRQYNGQKKKTDNTMAKKKKTDNTMAKRKRTNLDLQYIKQNIKNRAYSNTRVKI